MLCSPKLSWHRGDGEHCDPNNISPGSEISLQKPAQCLKFLLCVNHDDPSVSAGESREEGSWAPCSTEQSKCILLKDSPYLEDEQLWMAKQTDGGRRRGAHDTGATVIISVISSNHCSTAAFPPASICST